jgi:hypothetical protein
MSEDRIVAHALEQATSSDFNAAQAAQSRRLSDYLTQQFAEHNVPLPAYNSGSVARAADAVKAVITGLNVVGGSNADSVTVSPGSLTQATFVYAPLTGPAWTGARDPATSVQTGINRAAVTVPYVSTAGLGLASTATDAWHLLCARLVEVIVLTDTVNIFDVPSQAFVPTSLTKRVELRVEFQWFLGTALSSNSTVMPALDVGGNDWEPLAYVSYVHTGGLITGANRGKVIDVARRVAGLTSEWQSPGGAGQDTISALPAELLARLASARSPDCGPSQSGSLSGIAQGAVNGERTLLSASPDHSQFAPIDATDGSSPTDWSLVHYYLCPLQGTTRRRWPLKSVTNASVVDSTSVARGLLVGSTIQPTRRRTNSAAITLFESAGVRGKYNNHAAIMAGTAQYIGSGHAFGSSGFSAIYPMVQSSGGSVLYPLGEQYYNDGWQMHWLCRSVATMSSGMVGPQLNQGVAIDLRSMVPHVATAVHLHFQCLGPSDYTSLILEVRNRVDNSGNGIGGMPAAANAYSGERLACAEIIGGNPMVGDAANWNFASATLRVPVGWVPMLAHADAAGFAEDYHLNLQGRITSRVAGTYVGDITIRLLGWEI